MQRRHVCTALTVLIALVAAIPGRAQTRTPKVFVLDQGAPAVTALDLNGTVLKTAPLQGTPSILLRTPDRHIVLVLDRGTGRDAGDAGFQAKTRSSVTILDAETLATRARVELGAGLETTTMLNTAGDRLAVICPGYASRRPEENMPRELITVNLKSGQVTGRLPLARPASAFFGTPDGATAIVLSMRDKPKQTPSLPAELQVIDLATPKSVATLTLDGDPRNPVLSADGKFVYLLDRGNPSGNPDKNVNGRVHVVSVAAGKVETVHDAGSKPRGLVLDDAGQQLLVLSDRAPKKGDTDTDRAGELRALRGARLIGPVATLPGAEFLRATADGKRIFVVGRAGIAGHSLQDLSPLSEMRKGVVTVQFAITPDGRRALSVWQQNLYTYDLENGKEMEKITTGRMSARILAALDASTATLNSQTEAKREALRKGKSHYYYTEYNVRDPNETIAVRPDSQAVYVLNRQTSDVTVVDANTGRVLEKVATDGSAVHFLPGAGIALVIDGSAVHAIDLATHKKLDDLATGSGYYFSNPDFSRDGKSAVINGSAGVLLINGATGKANSKIVPFKRVVDIEVDWK